MITRKCGMIIKSGLALIAILICNPIEAGIGSTRFAPKAVSPRKIEIGNKPQITLVSNGKTNIEIVVPSSSSRTLRYAAGELALYLGKITGEKIPIVTAPSKQKCAIFLGQQKIVSEAGLDLKKLDRDGFYIKSWNGNLIIAGNDDKTADPATVASWNERGTLFGVYDFLERFGGVRFYFPGDLGTIVPQKKDWKLPAIHIEDRPDSQFRRIYSVEIKDLTQGKKDFLPKELPPFSDVHRLCMLRTRMSTLWIPPCHSLAFLGLVERYSKTHPEYFAMKPDGSRMDGSNVVTDKNRASHLCFSSGIKEEIYQDAAAFLSGKPASSRNIVMPNGKSYWNWQFFSAPFFNLMPNDGMYACNCPKCKAVYAKGLQAVSNMVWKFKTDIANRLLKNKIPGYITTMAYSPYRLVPDCKIPTNVIVQLAVTGPWNEENKALQAKQDQLLKDWYNKLGYKTYLWTYATKSGNMIADIPNFTPGAVASYFKRTSDYTFGAFLEAETDHWLFGFMNFYIFGKVMWDHSADVNAIINEHCDLMYGSGAAQMKKVYDIWEKHWLKDILSNIKDTPYGPQSIPPTSYEIWTKIYSEAEIKRIDALFDQAEKAAAKETSALARIKFIRREIWKKVTDARENYIQSVKNRNAWTTCMPEATGKITIDGKLSENDWKKCLSVHMVSRRTNGPIEVSTQVRMLHDKENIYISFESEEPFTDRMQNVKRKKDDGDLWQDNLVELFLTDAPQSPVMYQIMLGSNGCVTDIRWSHRVKLLKWDSKMEYKYSVVPGKKWIAEVRIPFSSVPELKGKKTFLANFTRGRKINGKKVLNYYTWTPFPVQIPENCGKVIVGDFPQKGLFFGSSKGGVTSKLRTVNPGEENSLISYGDMDGKLMQKRFIGEGWLMTNWYGKKALNHDKGIFLTRGASIRLEWDGVNDRACQTIRGLKPNTRYRFSYYLRMENVKPESKNTKGFFAGIRLGGTSRRRQFIPLPQQAMQGSIGWTRLETVFETGPDVGKRWNPWVEFYLNNCSGKVWIDHVRLVEIK